MSEEAPTTFVAMLWTEETAAGGETVTTPCEREFRAPGGMTVEQACKLLLREGFSERG